MNGQAYFRGKKVTQLGLGLLGRGVKDAEFLAECGADLVVTDKKTADELKPSIDRLSKFPNIKFVLGEHRLEDFRGRDFILKGAGVPLDSPFIAEARKNGIPIEMDASLFCKLAPEGLITIGVTGTRGKSTTATLIYEILKVAGLRVFLAGNIKDRATLPLLTEVKTGDYVVMELDSWQLQGFADSHLSPKVAVFTTFFPDHMNYYGGNLADRRSFALAMERYFEDKSAIFTYQGKEDLLVVGEQAARVRSFPRRARLAKLVDAPKRWKTQLLGEHNRLNTACAVKTARHLNIPDVVIKTALEQFVPIEGRLALVGEYDGVKIYNDNNSTTPEATIAALKAIGKRRTENREPRTENREQRTENGEPRKIVLIVGGSDKGLNMAELINEIPTYCKAVILLPGSGSDKIKDQISKIKITIQNVKNLDEAMWKAMEIGKPGDVVLFSPAFASFGPPPGGFKNEYDRGEQFLRSISSFKRQD